MSSMNKLQILIAIDTDAGPCLLRKSQMHWQYNERPHIYKKSSKNIEILKLRPGLIDRDAVVFRTRSISRYLMHILQWPNIAQKGSAVTTLQLPHDTI